MTRKIVFVAATLALLASLAGCSGGGSGRSSVHYGVGYGSYYGASPWHHYPGRPVYIDTGPDIPDGPVATPLPEFGMPDGGMMDIPDFDF
jgi:hypothetical protein